MSSNEEPTTSMVELDSNVAKPSPYDRIIIVEGKEFPVISKVLIDISEYFRAMFTAGFKEASETSIVLNEVSAVHFASFLKFVHTALYMVVKKQKEPNITGDEWKKEVSKLVLSAINEYNVFPIISMADRFTAPAIISLAEIFITISPSKIDPIQLLKLGCNINSQSLKMLSFKLMKHISDTIETRIYESHNRQRMAQISELPPDGKFFKKNARKLIALELECKAFLREVYPAIDEIIHRF